jgi:tellurium resistance protein TerZ
MTSTIPSLSKDDTATLTGRIRIGAAWDVSARGHGGLMGRLSRKAGADLDAVAVMFEDGEPVRMAGIGNDDPLKNGTVIHSGDNQTGAGEGDDETIDIDLDKVDAEVEKIVLMVAAFKQKNKNLGDVGFGGANNVEFTVYDASVTPHEKAFRIRPSLLGRENCVIVAVLKRASYGWAMTKSSAKVNVEHGNVQKLLMAAVNAG